jgi:putative hydrolase, CocE/NonD family
MGRGSTGPGSTSRRTCDVASAFLEHRPQSKPRLNGRPTATGSATTGHCPLCQTSKVLPRWYYEWMRHPPRDSWWKWATLEGKYSAVSAAVLNISGWFDEPYGPFGAVTNYQGLVTSRDASDPRTKLILGAWTHGVAAVQREKAGDRLFGSDAAIDYDETVLRWMDRYLKNAENGLDSDPSVRVFVMGANTWRTSQVWPFEGTRTDTLFLAGSVDSKSNGRLEHGESRSSGSSTVRSDPAHPLADPYEGRAGVHDCAALTGRPDIAVFETAPFKSAVDVIGPVVAELSVGSKLPDFDVWVQVYDVTPEGQAWNLTTAGSGLQRASYRDGGPDRKPLQPGQIVSLRLDRLFHRESVSPRPPPSHRSLHRVHSMVLGESANWRARALLQRGSRGRRSDSTLERAPVPPATSRSALIRFSFSRQAAYVQQVPDVPLCLSSHRRPLVPGTPR